ncbi:8058_t:CDS:2 [Dentiscutata erythropus]|uniref:8058_t:CDS:1 n=1 Tax=Dentiscutata erythropus TaxID=1348616 RepID=A0A9N9GIB3_9GLOM|nr:8058_t:CDS:2 [Dentiscutata erythropus]
MTSLRRYTLYLMSNDTSFLLLFWPLAMFALLFLFEISASAVEMISNTLQENAPSGTILSMMKSSDLKYSSRECP